MARKTLGETDMVESLLQWTIITAMLIYSALLVYIGKDLLRRRPRSGR